MTERENFLERWSRKKTEAVAVAEADVPPAPPRDDAAVLPADPTPNETPATPAPTPEFDLTKLPSLESITSATDVRAFLSPGVPQELTRAALRRAWTADPAIRNFVGLAENAWDFTDPNAMPGFGDLPLGFDVKKLVAEVFGELGQVGETETGAPRAVAAPSPRDMAESTAAPSRPEAQEGGKPPAQTPAIPHAAAPAADTDFLVQRKSIAATQYNEPADETLEPARAPRHGSAIPK